MFCDNKFFLIAEQQDNVVLRLRSTSIGIIFETKK